MFGCGWFAGTGFWWIFPIIVVAMMLFCFFVMRRRGMGRGTGCCGGGPQRPRDEQDPSLR